MQGKFLNYGQLHIALRDTIEAAPSTLTTLHRAAHNVLSAVLPFGFERSLDPHDPNALLNSGGDTNW
jgi:hypothetical protein